MKKLSFLFRELGTHLPYTIGSALLGVGFIGLGTAVAGFLQKESFLPDVSETFFHIFHPVHLLFSAVATTMLFYKYERKISKAAIVGFLGAVGFCGISDVLIPYIGGNILSVEMEFHLCLFSHPHLVLPFIIIGIISAIAATDHMKKAEIYSHSVHVLISSMASIMYLMSFGITNWISSLGAVFLIVLLAVLLPCCMSDVVFPLMMTKDPG